MTKGVLFLLFTIAYAIVSLYVYTTLDKGSINEFKTSKILEVTKNIE